MSANKTAQKVNSELHALGYRLHDSLGQALSAVQEALSAAGFEWFPDCSFYGNSGVIHQPVGNGLWLHACFYVRETGRVEVTAYVS